MIVDFLLVLLVVLIVLNFRQYRKKDTETFQSSLDALRRDLFAKVSILEASLHDPDGNTRNDRGDVYRELETLRSELAIIIDSKKRSSDPDEYCVSDDAALNPETETEETIHGK